MSTAAKQAKFRYDVVTDFDHLEEIVALQKAVWGEDVVTSLPQMVAANHNGGVVIAVFDDNKGRMAGFCYGFPGFSELSDKPYLCSHMMAINPDYQNQGLGEQLKFEQRKWAITYGYEKIVWTFDPLEARNAYLNLCKLGAYAKTYIKSVYGEMKDKVNIGIPSDRFHVEWDLHSPTVTAAANGKRNVQIEWKDYQKLVNIQWQDGIPVPDSLNHIGDGPGHLLPVPANHRTIKESAPDVVMDWRMMIRHAAQKAFAADYKVVGILRDPSIAHYVLVQNRQSRENRRNAIDQ
ncbi:GNAT family N-acetyltransferase [Pseudalkalibacillus sp. R45]|uniref:GNAT family N-acetyltransferase n=1 Tax=Pseudalkalibacillus sp. R45 TaxID=3457433 RepID=UPI003FCEB638